ncbi:MAG TPA: DoxX family protein [Planctomycetota bacterium]
MSVIPRLAPYSDRAYALLRIVAGFMFSLHGWQKILGALGGQRPPFGSQMWLGGLIELVGGTLILLGLFTRGAAFVASGTMAVAYIQFHWHFAFDAGFFPVVNKGELALLYCFLFFYMVFRGAGPWSLDARRVQKA